MECPHCGEELSGGIQLFVPERDKPEITYTDVIKMYEMMAREHPLKDTKFPMNTESYSYVPMGVFDCVDGT